MLSEKTDQVVLETMPDSYRQSHKNANNWGTFPHNGAVRTIVPRNDALTIVANDPDGYASIVDEVPSTPEMLELRSTEFIAKPSDARCQYWAKLYRAGDLLPEPGNVEGGASLPGKFLRKGADLELYEGDSVITAEANHHRKLRGWVVRAFTVCDGCLVELPTDATAKRMIKETTLAPEIKRGLLSGSGTVAAAVRALHCVRLQIEVVFA